MLRSRRPPLDALAAHLGRRERSLRHEVLAVGAGTDVAAYGLPGILIVQRGDDWESIGWHQISRGGWDAASATLRWTRLDGTEHSVELSEPARLPELFKERVQASILAEERVPVPGGLAVVSARRDLSRPDAPLTWTAVPVGAVRLDQPGVPEAVVTATQRMQAELA